MSSVSGISAFFPAFNERENLARMIASLRDVLSVVSDSYEIIIVDDGSQDGTGPLAEELAHRYPEVRVVHHPRNLGYGAAVRSGIAVCRYPVIFFTDGDCQFDVRELTRLLPFLGSYDIVTGYRQRRADPLIRWFYAAAWRWLVRNFTGVRVKDINCAFKLFKAEVVKPMVLTGTGSVINAEIFALATRRGASIYEVPISHYARRLGHQTGGHLRVIVRAAKELVQLVRKLRAC